MENRKKLCCTCGRILPLENFPMKPNGHRREADCEECINNQPLVRQRPRILGKSPIPPRLGRMHQKSSKVFIIDENPRITSENNRAIQVWENRLMRFARKHGWFTAKDAKEPVQYSLPVVRNILNTLSSLGFLEKNDEPRVKLYRIKQNQPLNGDETGLIAE